MKEILHPKIEAYVFQEAKSGNMESGDTYYTYITDEYFLCAIADGLGNGPVARQSAAVIPKIMEQFPEESIDSLLLRSNAEMFQKRGAAVALVKVHFATKTIEYSCVGNVKFYMIRQGDEKMIYPLPVMGYLSGRPQKLRTQSYTYQTGDLFLLHSDGVVINSPKNLMKDSGNAKALYNQIINTIEHGDDATFITANLLQ